MPAYLLLGDEYPVEEEANIRMVIVVESAERAAQLAGGEFCGPSLDGGWLVGYKRELFSEPLPEERDQYTLDDETGATLLVFRFRHTDEPIVVLRPEENIAYLRLIEVPLITG